MSSMDLRPPVCEALATFCSFLHGTETGEAGTLMAV